MSEQQFDRRDLSHLFTRHVGFSVKRHDYTVRGMRAHALETLVRQLPEVESWDDHAVAAAVQRLAYIDKAVVMLRRHIRLLHGGSLRDRQLATRARNENALAVTGDRPAVVSSCSA